MEEISVPGLSGGDINRIIAKKDGHYGLSHFLRPHIVAGDGVYVLPKGWVSYAAYVRDHGEAALRAQLQQLREEFHAHGLDADWLTEAHLVVHPDGPILRFIYRVPFAGDPTKASRAFWQRVQPPLQQKESSDAHLCVVLLPPSNAENKDIHALIKAFKAVCEEYAESGNLRLRVLCPAAAAPALCTEWIHWWPDYQPALAPKQLYQTADYLSALLVCAELCEKQEVLILDHRRKDDKESAITAINMAEDHLKSSTKIQWR
ncbi:MAG: hypothetical protein LBN05_02645 [Oscillospiraceae bacterium]|jgi:hypothetical protein|nr:hypothetical protein [Oscillospiraceae bacterium]